jgi:hypothetical protein
VERWIGWERQAPAWQKNAGLGLGAPRDNKPNNEESLVFKQKRKTDTSAFQIPL